MRKYWFYICLVIIYILFLSKDYLFKMYNNKDDINNFIALSNDINLKEEVIELKKMLDLDIKDNKVIYSEVINRNMYDFYNKITISKGSSDGIKKGMLVVSDIGVVGLISNVFNNYSDVYLLTNKNINLSVKVNDAYGILESINNKIYIKNIKLTENVNVNDKVYTSGLTKILGNVYIGTVDKVEKDSLGLEYKLELKLANDLKKIKFVGVIAQ